MKRIQYIKPLRRLRVEVKAQAQINLGKSQMKQRGLLNKFWNKTYTPATKEVSVIFTSDLKKTNLLSKHEGNIRLGSCPHPGVMSTSSLVNAEKAAVLGTWAAWPSGLLHFCSLAVSWGNHFNWNIFKSQIPRWRPPFIMPSFPCFPLLPLRWWQQWTAIQDFFFPLICLLSKLVKSILQARGSVIWDIWWNRCVQQSPF